MGRRSGILAVATIAYALAGGDDFTDRATSPDRWDVIVGIIFIVLVLEATRRTTGAIMPVVAIFFIAYAMLGPHLPAPWTHRGYDLSRLVGHLFITLEGIFGVAVDVSATLIILFTIFGAFLQQSGAGKFFIDFSLALMGGKPNSAGRTVVLSSFPARRPFGLGRRHHGHDRHRCLSDDEKGRLREERSRRPSGPRAASARSCRRRCWAPRRS